MTRKDYCLLAAAIAGAASATMPGPSLPAHADPARKLHRAIAFTLANALACDNSRFDRQRFLTACGVAT
jgi:hypothetical protein